jgi:hypothetical protein
MQIKPTITSKPQNLTSDAVVNFIIDNFSYEMNTKKNREKIMYNLNRVFFPDNIATFIDTSSDEELYSGNISMMIEYKGIQYNLLAFENQYTKISRKRKLDKINELY